METEKNDDDFFEKVLFHSGYDWNNEKIQILSENDDLQRKVIDFTNLLTLTLRSCDDFENKAFIEALKRKIDESNFFSAENNASTSNKTNKSNKYSKSNVIRICLSVSKISRPLILWIMKEMKDETEKKDKWLRGFLKEIAKTEVVVNSREFLESLFSLMEPYSVSENYNQILIISSLPQIILGDSVCEILAFKLIDLLLFSSNDESLTKVILETLSRVSLKTETLVTILESLNKTLYSFVFVSVLSYILSSLCSCNILPSIKVKILSQIRNGIAASCVNDLNLNIMETLRVYSLSGNSNLAQFWISVLDSLSYLSSPLDFLLLLYFYGIPQYENKICKIFKKHIHNEILLSKTIRHPLFPEIYKRFSLENGFFHLLTFFYSTQKWRDQEYFLLLSREAFRVPLENISQRLLFDILLSNHLIPSQRKNSLSLLFRLSEIAECSFLPFLFQKVVDKLFANSLNFNLSDFRLANQINYIFSLKISRDNNYVKIYISKVMGLYNSWNFEMVEKGIIASIYLLSLSDEVRRFFDEKNLMRRISMSNESSFGLLLDEVSRKIQNQKDGKEKLEFKKWILQFFNRESFSQSFLTPQLNFQIPSLSNSFSYLSQILNPTSHSHSLDLTSCTLVFPYFRLLRILSQDKDIENSFLVFPQYFSLSQHSFVCHFNLVNWYRELVNGESREVFLSLLLQGIVKLEKEILGHKECFRPPTVCFGEEFSDWRKSIQDSQKNISFYTSFFRELDLRALCKCFNAISVPGIHLTEEVFFLLRDFDSKVRHIYEAPFQENKWKNAGFSNLDSLPKVYVNQFIVSIVSYLCIHLEKSHEYLNQYNSNNSNSTFNENEQLNDYQELERLHFSNLKQIYSLLLVFFSKVEFLKENNPNFLKDFLSVFARRCYHQTSSNSSSSSSFFLFHNLIIKTWNYFLNFCKELESLLLRVENYRLPTIKPTLYSIFLPLFQILSSSFFVSLDNSKKECFSICKNWLLVSYRSPFVSDTVPVSQILLSYLLPSCSYTDLRELCSLLKSSTEYNKRKNLRPLLQFYKKGFSRLLFLTKCDSFVNLTQVSQLMSLYVQYQSLFKRKWRKGRKSASDSKILMQFVRLVITYSQAFVKVFNEKCMKVLVKDFLVDKSTALNSLTLLQKELQSLRRSLYERKDDGIKCFLKSQIPSFNKALETLLMKVKYVLTVNKIRKAFILESSSFLQETGPENRGSIVKYNDENDLF